jgi:hypothetical protein
MVMTISPSIMTLSDDTPDPGVLHEVHAAVSGRDHCVWPKPSGLETSGGPLPPTMIIRLARSDGDV